MSIRAYEKFGKDGASIGYRAYNGDYGLARSDMNELSVPMEFHEMLDDIGLFEPLKAPSINLTKEDKSAIIDRYNKLITEELVPYIENNYNFNVMQFEQSGVPAKEIERFHKENTWSSFLESMKDDQTINAKIAAAIIDVESINVKSNLAAYEKMESGDFGSLDYHKVQKTDLIEYCRGALCYNRFDKEQIPAVNRLIMEQTGENDVRAAAKKFLKENTDFKLNWGSKDLKVGNLYFSPAVRRLREAMEQSAEERTHNETQKKDLEIKNAYIEQLKSMNTDMVSLEDGKQMSRTELLVNTYGIEQFKNNVMNPSSSGYSNILESMDKLVKENERLIREKDGQFNPQIKTNNDLYQSLAQAIERYPHNEAILASRDSTRLIKEMKNSTLLSLEESVRIKNLGIGDKCSSVSECFEIANRTDMKSAKMRFMDATEEFFKIGIRSKVDNEKVLELISSENLTPEEVIQKLLEMTSNLDQREAEEVEKIDKLFENAASIKEKYENKMLNEIYKMIPNIKDDEKEKIKTMLKETLENENIGRSVYEESNVTAIISGSNFENLKNTVIDIYNSRDQQEKEDTGKVLDNEKISGNINRELNIYIKKTNEAVKKANEALEQSKKIDKNYVIEKLSKDSKADIKDTLIEGCMESFKKQYADKVTDYRDAVKEYMTYKKASDIANNHKIIFTQDDMSVRYSQDYPSAKTVKMMMQSGLLGEVDKKTGEIIKFEPNPQNKNYTIKEIDDIMRKEALKLCEPGALAKKIEDLNFAKQKMQETQEQAAKGEKSPNMTSFDITKNAKLVDNALDLANEGFKRYVETHNLYSTIANGKDLSPEQQMQRNINESVQKFISYNDYETNGPALKMLSDKDYGYLRTAIMSENNSVPFNEQKIKNLTETENIKYLDESTTKNVAIIYGNNIYDIGMSDKSQEKIIEVINEKYQENVNLMMALDVNDSIGVSEKEKIYTSLSETHKEISERIAEIEEREKAVSKKQERIDKQFEMEKNMANDDKSYSPNEEAKKSEEEKLNLEISEIMKAKVELSKEYGLVADAHDGQDISIDILKDAESRKMAMAFEICDKISTEEESKNFAALVKDDSYNESKFIEFTNLISENKSCIETKIEKIRESSEGLIEKSNKEEAEKRESELRASLVKELAIITDINAKGIETAIQQNIDREYMEALSAMNFYRADQLKESKAIISDVFNGVSRGWETDKIENKEHVPEELQKMYGNISRTIDELRESNPMIKAFLTAETKDAILMETLNINSANKSAIMEQAKEIKMNDSDKTLADEINNIRDILITSSDGSKRDAINIIQEYAESSKVRNSTILITNEDISSTTKQALSETIMNSVSQMSSSNKANVNNQLSELISMKEKYNMAMAEMMHLMKYDKFIEEISQNEKIRSAMMSSSHTIKDRIYELQDICNDMEVKMEDKFKEINIDDNILKEYADKFAKIAIIEEEQHKGRNIGNETFINQYGEQIKVNSIEPFNRDSLFESITYRMGLEGINASEIKEMSNAMIDKMQDSEKEEMRKAFIKIMNQTVPNSTMEKIYDYLEKNGYEKDKAEEVYGKIMNIFDATKQVISPNNIDNISENKLDDIPIKDRVEMAKILIEEGNLTKLNSAGTNDFITCFTGRSNDEINHDINTFKEMEKSDSPNLDKMSNIKGYISEYIAITNIMMEKANQIIPEVRGKVEAILESTEEIEEEKEAFRKNKEVSGMEL